MKKLILILCIFLLWGCKEEVEEPVDEPIVIELDEESYHNTKLITNNNSIPHTIKYYEEMDDDVYGNFIIEMIDSKFQAVWTYKWRDMEKNGEPFALDPLIYQDLMIVNVQGVISVHDLLTGEFKWELETNEINKGFAVYGEMLYVMYLDEDFITGVDLISGEKKIHITEDYPLMDKLAASEGKIIAYYESSDKYERNGLEYNGEGAYLRKMHHTSEVLQYVYWDLAESSDESDTAVNLIDGSLKTAWTESVKSYGENEWIEVTKQLPTLVHQLIVYNGDHTSEKAYNENAKLKKAVISIGDGKSFEYEFTEFEYMTPDVIQFVKPITADYILITIEEAEPGSLFKNTGITELYTQ